MKMRKTPYDSHKLSILVKKRETKHITQEEMARYFDLGEKRGRDTVGRWERGQGKPKLYRRTDFIKYLCEYLKLDKEEFSQVWTILVDQWRWSDLNEVEWQTYFPAKAELPPPSRQDVVLSQSVPNTDVTSTSPNSKSILIRAQIYVEGDLSSLSPERKSAAIEAFAAVMGIPATAIQVYGIYSGSIIFDLGIPPDVAGRLQFLLTQKYTWILRPLRIERVTIEGHRGRIEDWLFEEGKFNLMGTSDPSQLTFSTPLKLIPTEKQTDREVFVKRIGRSIKPIAGASMGVVAFVGFTERAGSEESPTRLLNKPTSVTNWDQFTQNFGGFIEGAFLPHAVYGYFINGGSECYIMSLKTLGTQIDPALTQFAQVILPSPSNFENKSLLIQARHAGPVGNQLSVIIEPEENEPITSIEDKDKEQTPVKNDLFTLIVKRDGIPVERFQNLTMRNDDNNVATVVNQHSRLVEIEIVREIGRFAEPRLVEAKYTFKEGVLTMPPSELSRDMNQQPGIVILETLDNVMLLVCPDLMSSHLDDSLDLQLIKAVQDAMLTHCERMECRFAILDSPLGMSPEEIRRWRLDMASYDSAYGALYYPWIAIPNPSDEKGAPILVPPCGHIAGVYARIANEHGIHKAPDNEIVLGVHDLEVNITLEEQNELNAIGVNCIRKLSGSGVRIFGAKTLSGNPVWHHINISRLFNLVKSEIETGTQWVVFERSNRDLWAQVRDEISSFLYQVWQSGALAGTTPKEAFYVKCDEELNPPEIRDIGLLNIEVGLAPVTPAAFLIFQVQHWVGLEGAKRWIEMS